MLSEDWLDNLSHESPETRHRYWLDLHRAVKTGRERLTFEDISLLLPLVAAEREAGQLPAWQIATEVVQIGIAEMLEDSARSPELVERRGAAAGHLGFWIVDPFRGHSLVLDAWDPTGRIRDEKAKTYLAVCMPVRDFANTELKSIELGEFRSTAEELGRADAVCFIGRLGLYGEDTPGRWCMPRSRFRFITELRPEGLARGVLDSENYHRILAKAGPRKRARSFRTQDDGNTRTDYGLVQRYVRRVNNHDYFVLRCAGGSAPGSLGAAKWIADLFTQNQVTGSIPVPDLISHKSNLEALIKVTATSRTGTAPWIVENTELVELYVNGREWYEKESCWGEITPKVIVLETSAPQDKEPQTIKDIYFDGERVNLQKNSGTRRQLVAVCQLASQNDGRIRFDDLVADTSVWGKPTENTEKFHRSIKGCVITLRKRYFRKALVDDADGWRLTSEIVYESAEPSVVKKPQKAKVPAPNSRDTQGPGTRSMPKPR